MLLHGIKLSPTDFCRVGLFYQGRFLDVVMLHLSSPFAACVIAGLVPSGLAGTGHPAVANGDLYSLCLVRAALRCS
jgi:hypothetical protein